MVKASKAKAAKAKVIIIIIIIIIIIARADDRARPGHAAIVAFVDTSPKIVNAESENLAHPGKNSARCKGLSRESSASTARSGATQ